MSDIQGSTPAGTPETPERPTAATEQTGSASVTTGSDAANPQDTAQEPADNAGADEGDSAKKQKSDVQKRIDSLRRQRGRAERERDQAREELERVRAQPQAKTPSTTDAKPQLSNFGSYDDYQEALTEWKVDQRLKVKDTEAQQSQRQQRQRAVQSERQEHFMESCEAAREKYEDFDDVVFSDENQVPAWAGGLIADLDDSAAVAYHLAKDPKEAKRIYSLRPEKAAIELGKLEVKLSAPKPKLTSTAPPPTSTPAGGGRALPKAPSKMSADELYAKFKG